MLIKLTGIPHPDINGGKSAPVYIDPTRVLVITRATTRQAKYKSIEAHRQAMNSLHEEVQRVSGELQNIPGMFVETEGDAKKIEGWAHVKEAAGALSAAYGLVARTQAEPEYHPDVECTNVSMACGTGLEHGVMLCRVDVVESPEEVAEKIQTLTRVLFS